MRVAWHPEAEAEMIEAAQFYDERVHGLGADFLDAIDEAVERLLANPHRFPIIENDIRRCRVKRFPFCVYFRQTIGAWRILVVKHHSRDPDYWKPRK